jgi:riboflavin biosynthesis pyrimidine reductase
MPKVIADIPMSLDGYVTGPGADEQAGLGDELCIHLAPMLLGEGTPLFRPGTRQMYRQRDVRPSKNAVHLAYERL